MSGSALSSPSTSTRALLTPPPGTQHNQLSSPLLRLPAELRDKIYTYALSDYEWIIEPYNNVLKCWQRSEYAFALLRTCRQIHFEACHFRYTLGNFVFMRPNDARLWAKSLADHNRALVTSIEFRIESHGLEPVWTRNGFGYTSPAWLCAEDMALLPYFPGLNVVKIGVMSRGMEVLGTTLTGKGGIGLTEVVEVANPGLKCVVEMMKDRKITPPQLAQPSRYKPGWL